MNHSITYSLAESSWDEKELQAIQSVIDSGRFTMGENVQLFEKDFARHFGSQHAVMVNSGSSANLLATAALFFKNKRPLKPGDEAIVPALAWSTTFSPLQQYGLKLRFVDIDLETLNLDMAQMEAALTPQTRMIVAVNILGNPCQLDAIRHFCDRHDLYFLEDNCESMGAELNGKACGTFGDVGTFSTFFSHHLCTMEGGMILTNNTEIAHILRALRSHGWTRDLPTDSPIFDKQEDPFFESYRFILPGYNVRPTEMSGAIGREQLKKLPQLITARRTNAITFQQLFRDQPHLLIQQEHGKSSWFGFSLVLSPDSPLERQVLLQKLQKSGIEIRPIIAGNFLRQEAIRYYEHTVFAPLANTNQVHDRGFMLGNHGTDLTKQLEKAAAVLASEPS